MVHLEQGKLLLPLPVPMMQEPTFLQSTDQRSLVIITVKVSNLCMMFSVQLRKLRLLWLDFLQMLSCIIFTVMSTAKKNPVTSLRDNIVIYNAESPLCIRKITTFFMTFVTSVFLMIQAT